MEWMMIWVIRSFSSSSIKYTAATRRRGGNRKATGFGN
jgi:hypothetical protein